MSLIKKMQRRLFRKKIFVGLLGLFLLFPIVFGTIVSAIPNGKAKGLEGRGIWLTPGYFMEKPEDAIRAVNEIADAGF